MFAIGGLANTFLLEQLTDSVCAFGIPFSKKSCRIERRQDLREVECG
jgi:hypothetical protein